MQYNKNELTDTVRKLTSPGKGILSTDEISSPQAKLVYSTTGLKKYVSGVIISDQNVFKAGPSLSFSPTWHILNDLSYSGILPGIRVDTHQPSLIGPKKQAYDVRYHFVVWRAVLDVSNHG